MYFREIAFFRFDMGWEFKKSWFLFENEEG